MKERLLDVMKWGLILVVAGAIFYAVCPKYEVRENVLKFNKITGRISIFKEAKEGLEKMRKQ